MAIEDAYFRHSFEQSAVGRMLVSVSADGRCVFTAVNAAAAAYFDCDAAAMAGKTASEIFSPEMAEHLQQAFETCLKSGKAVTIPSLPGLPGEARPARALVLNSIAGKEKKTLYIDISILADMSDEKQLQREREDVIRLLTSVFDASGLGIVVTDRHRRIVRVNNAFLKEFGWGRGALVGEFYTKLIPEFDRDTAAQRHEEFLNTGEASASREIQILRGDGSRAHVLVNMARLEMSQRRRFVVATFQDITALKQIKENLRIAKEEADSASKAKSAFLANMSHELRTPLNAIIGFSELMKNETFGPIQNEKYADYMKDIHFSARHLLDIINDVLDMSKIEAGKVELIESEVCIGELYQSVLRIMSDRANAEKVALKVDLAPQLPHLKADQRLLRQMVLNLVSNAVKFSSAGQTVLLEGRAGSSGLRLTVRDSGCGIPKEKQALVLEPFGQVEEPSRTKRHGTGLGLPLAKAMAELHGGILTIESEVSKGTSVHLDFPAERLLKPVHHHAAAH